MLGGPQKIRAVRAPALECSKDGQRMEITKSVNVLRLARFQAILFALLGLFAGVLYSFGGIDINFD